MFTGPFELCLGRGAEPHMGYCHACKFEAHEKCPICVAGRYTQTFFHRAPHIYSFAAYGKFGEYGTTHPEFVCASKAVEDMKKRLSDLVGTDQITSFLMWLGGGEVPLHLPSYVYVKSVFDTTSIADLAEALKKMAKAEDSGHLTLRQHDCESHPQSLACEFAGQLECPVHGAMCQLKTRKKNNVRITMHPFVMLTSSPILVDDPRL